MKAVLLVIFISSLLNAGSTTAISNQFSLGSVGVEKKSNLQHNRASNYVINMFWRNDGIFFKMNGTEKIHSLSIIRTNGSIVKSFSTAGVESVFWDGCSSHGAKLPRGCYLVIVNKQCTKAFILSGKGSEK